jgi:hypothetical protein
LSGIIRKLGKQLTDPREFFRNVQNENWRPAFVFFVWITFIISLVTPVLNYFGMKSNDVSSSYQAQILAYNLVKNSLIDLYGVYAYLIETFLIFAFSIPILLFLTLLLHLIYRLVGGKGPISYAWKATCYGIGPCLLGGFLPYISLFAGFYSFAMQFYLGPMSLYQAKEGRAIVVFVAFIALTFIEMFVLALLQVLNIQLTCHNIQSNFGLVGWTKLDPNQQ